MTWNEFKNYVDNQLSAKEKDYQIFYIDTGNYPEIKYNNHIEVFVSKNEIAIH